MNIIKAATIAFLFGLFSSAAAQADVLAVATRNSSTTINSTLFNIPLDLSGTPYIEFTTKDRTYVSIVFTAECGTYGDIGSWVTVRITLDGGSVRPDSTTVFCTAPVQNLHTYVGASRQVVLIVSTPPGKHRARVAAQYIGSGHGHINTTSVVVYD